MIAGAKLQPYISYICLLKNKMNNDKYRDRAVPKTQTEAVATVSVTFFFIKKRPAMMNVRINLSQTHLKQLQG